MVDMPACHLQLKMESKTECSLLTYSLFVKIKHLPLLSTYNLLSTGLTFFHLPISLVLVTHSLIEASEYAQVGVNYSLMIFSKTIFLKK